MKRILLIALCLVFITSFALASQVRVIYNPDQSVAMVIHPAPQSKKDAETEEEWLSRVFAETTETAGLEGLVYDDIEKSDLPSRSDRKYWKGEPGKKMTIDNNKKQLDILEKLEKKNAIKTKLGLSDKEIDDLREILK